MLIYVGVIGGVVLPGGVWMLPPAGQKVFFFCLFVFTAGALTVVEATQSFHIAVQNEAPNLLESWKKVRTKKKKKGAESIFALLFTASLWISVKTVGS